MSLGSRLQHAWNAFMNRDPTSYGRYGSSIRPDRIRFTRGNERSIIVSIYNRIALDVTSINIEHVRLDSNGRFKEIIESGLNNCLTLDANIDQTARALLQDLVMSMFDEGVVALVPVDTSISPTNSDGYDINTLRTAKIQEWFPTEVRVEIYNDRTGKKQSVVLPKKMVAIIENPFYSVMNERNSVAQRLVRKLNLLDAIDEQCGSDKLNMIIQLPYLVKSEAKRKYAEERRAQIEDQLTNNKFGIAYIDGTEHITQLNRSLDNDLMNQIKYLTDMMYSQLGITQSIMDGTADDKTMLNYYNRTIEPIVSAIVDELKRKFLSKTARTRGQSILFFRDPFKLVPVADLAEIADKFTRNEIASSNEMRQVIGMKPVEDEKADELRNKNLNPGEGQEFASATEEEDYEEDEYLE